MILANFSATRRTMLRLIFVAALISSAFLSSQAYVYGQGNLAKPKPTPQPTPSKPKTITASARRDHPQCLDSSPLVLSGEEAVK
jgi:hypothetical protein